MSWTLANNSGLVSRLLNMSNTNDWRLSPTRSRLM